MFNVFHRAHLESETCVATRIQLDRLAEACEYSKDYVIPGCEAHLRTRDRKRWTPKAVLKSNTGRSGCSDCNRQFSTATAFSEHLRSSTYHPLAYQCAGCGSQYPDLSPLIAHVEVSDCGEGVAIRSLIAFYAIPEACCWGFFVCFGHIWAPGAPISQISFLAGCHIATEGVNSGTGNIGQLLGHLYNNLEQ